MDIITAIINAPYEDDCPISLRKEQVEDESSLTYSYLDDKDELIAEIVILKGQGISWDIKSDDFMEYLKTKGD